MLIVYNLEIGGVWLPDSVGYWRLGENMVSNGVFSQDIQAPFQPDFYRTPLYPFFLGCINMLGGKTFGVLVLQNLMCILTALFVFKVAKGLSNTVIISKFAALLFLVDIPSLVIANTALTETLFTLLLIISIRLIQLSFYEKKSKWIVILLGASLGLMTLCRPSALYLPLLLIPLILFFKGSWYLKFKQLAIVLITFFIVLSPWFYRNYKCFDRIFVSTIGKYVSYNFHAADIVADETNVDFAKAQYRLRLTLYEDYCSKDGIDNVECADMAALLAKKIIKRNPGAFAKNMMVNVGYLWLKPIRSYIDNQVGSDNGYIHMTEAGDMSVTNKLFKNSSKFTVIMVSLQLLISFVVLLGFVLGIRSLVKQKKYVMLALFLTMILYFSLMVVPPSTDARFRVPIIPLLSILAAIGISGVMKLLMNRYNKDEAS